MIVFNLSCSDCDFSFEGWFENTKDYNKQIRKGLLTCPSCNSTQIKKGLMAPNVRSIEYTLFQKEVEDFFTGVDYVQWTDEECEFIRELLKTETQ